MARSQRYAAVIISYIPYNERLNEAVNSPRYPILDVSLPACSPAVVTLIEGPRRRLIVAYAVVLLLPQTSCCSRCYPRRRPVVACAVLLLLPQTSYCSLCYRLDTPAYVLILLHTSCCSLVVAAVAPADVLL